MNANLVADVHKDSRNFVRCLQNQKKTIVNHTPQLLSSNALLSLKELYIYNYIVHSAPTLMFIT